MLDQPESRINRPETAIDTPSSQLESSDASAPAGGLAENVWLTLCFFLSCYFYGAELNPLLALPALLGPLGVLAFASSNRVERLRRDAPTLFYSCIAAIVLIIGHQLIFSRAPGTSFVPGVVLVCLPLWALVVALLKAPRQLWIMISVLVTAFAVLSALEFVFTRQRAHAPLRDPGNYATLLYMIWLPWLVALLGVKLSGRARVLYAGLFALLLLALLATHLRFAMLLVAGVPALLLLGWWRYRLAALNVGAAFVALAVALLFYLLLDSTGVSSAFAGGEAASQGPDPRVLLWMATWQAIVQEGGLNGTGLAAFAELYPQFRSAHEQTTAGLVAHNDLLQLMLEGGLWFFLPMVLFYLATGVALLRALFRGEGPTWRLGWLLALALAMLHATVNFLFYVLPLTLLAAIIAGLVFRSTKGGSERLEPGVWVKGLRVLAPVLLLANVGWMLVDITTMGVARGYHQAPLSGYLKETDARLMAYARLAQTLNPRRGDPIVIEARLLAQRFAAAPSQAAATQADLAYQRALELQPWDPATHLERADFQNGVIAAGVSLNDRRGELYQRAQTLMPSSAATNAALISWYFAQGDHPAALQVMSEVTKWCYVLAREPSAGQLLGELASAAATLGAPAQEEALRQCSQAVGRESGSGRHKRLLMRFFGD